ncbi:MULTISPECIES: hypothetical protein [Streptomyces]|uniref:hypothetical protein n=1 Tax=Streptomyces TaxID=1883 RepID=UPI000A414EE9|nr:hypothetical protein [Streptomyces prasinus]
MGIKMTMTTRYSVSVRWHQVRVVIILVVLVVLSVLARGHGDTTLIDAVLPHA